MSPRTIRRLVVAVFVIGIVGMIVGSIADDNGVAVTFGLLSAAAAVGLILVTASAPADAFAAGGRARARDAGTPSGEAGQAGDGDGDAAGQAIEEQVARLVAGGADEHDVRELVRRSVAFGRLRR